MRPAIVVLSSGVLLSLSLFGSVAFAFYYVMATSLPDVLEGLYNLTPAAAGLSFMSFSKYTCPVISSAPVPWLTFMQALAQPAASLCATGSLTTFTSSCVTLTMVSANPSIASRWRLSEE
jgi:hypothetical protein